eukprot:TRINITY_DN791_c0_g1_i10.p2 TRINITY_DN791_c0_g1~~TRINITY_DN791_c0_g1_i10.p2  ORF type:complete len:138 (+),score=5.94 TRINITY_DN791_c0_g1_i10:31-414(+)
MVEHKYPTDEMIVPAVNVDMKSELDRVKMTAEAFCRHPDVRPEREAILHERLDTEEKMGDFAQSVIKRRTANSSDLKFITRTLLAYSKGETLREVRRRSSQAISPPSFTTRKIDFDRIGNENLFDVD